MAKISIDNGEWNDLTVIDGAILIVSQKGNGEPNPEGEELITIGDEALGPLIELLTARKMRGDADRLEAWRRKRRRL